MSIGSITSIGKQNISGNKMYRVKFTASIVYGSTSSVDVEGFFIASQNLQNITDVGQYIQNHGYSGSMNTLYINCEGVYRSSSNYRFFLQKLVKSTTGVSCSYVTSESQQSSTYTYNINNIESREI